MNNSTACMKINIGVDNPINHFTFDGNHYFCTIETKFKIIKLNKDFEIKETYHTSKKYDCICYDLDDECFWASISSCNNKIFKLDLDMHEIGCISINEIKTDDKITGISYNCAKNSLIISFNHIIIALDKKSDTTKIIYSEKCVLIKDIVSISPALIVTVLKNEKIYVLILLNSENILKCYCLGKNIKIKNLIFNPCKCNKNNLLLEIFVAQKHNEICVCNWSIQKKDLCFKVNCCNYKLCEKYKCKKNIDPCNDIIESIAYIEASIAHILNAEGEKIQKVLAHTDDIDTILCVNKEVNKTIVNVTHLEHILYDKLSKILDSPICCKEVCKNNPCKNNHCNDNPCKNDDKC